MAAPAAQRRGRPPEPKPEPVPSLPFAYLAENRCTHCLGIGQVPLYKPKRLCNCVYRAVFESCFAEFWKNQNSGRLSQPRLWKCAANGVVGNRDISGSRMRALGRPTEEFSADFWLTAKRTLDSKRLRVLSLHFLQGLPWTACCKQTGLSRGNFFHAIYQVKEKLGKAFLETQPYALYPVGNYYQQPKDLPPISLAPDLIALRLPLVAPLREVQC